VTLHNQALFQLDHQPAGSLAKLQYLLRQQSFPAETFENLLLLYTKYEVCHTHTHTGPHLAPCNHSFIHSSVYFSYKLPGKRMQKH